MQTERLTRGDAGDRSAEVNKKTPATLPPAIAGALPEALRHSGSEPR
jgi:hypothetical protein